jgi:hypothetical protein
MKNSRIALVLMSVMLLVVLAIGPVAPGVAARLAEPALGATDGLHNLLAPVCGGGSGG